MIEIEIKNFYSEWLSSTKSLIEIEEKYINNKIKLGYDLISVIRLEKELSARYYWQKNKKT